MTSGTDYFEGDGSQLCFTRVKFTAILRIDCKGQRQNQGHSQQVLLVIQPQAMLAWPQVVAMDVESYIPDIF